MTHGTRATYQRFACRCTPCRAAEAAYRHALRLQIAKGLDPAGRLIDAALVRKMVKGMVVEGFTFAEVARRLGTPCQRFRLVSDRVTIARFLAVRALYYRTLVEGSDGPDEPIAANG